MNATATGDFADDYTASEHDEHRKGKKKINFVVVVGVFFVFVLVFFLFSRVL